MEVDLQVPLRLSGTGVHRILVPLFVALGRVRTLPTGLPWNPWSKGFLVDIPSGWLRPNIKSGSGRVSRHTLLRGKTSTCVTPSLRKATEGQVRFPKPDLGNCKD